MTRKRLYILLAVVVVASVACFFRPYPTPDEKKVHPTLFSLKKPYSGVTMGYFMDGGSIGVTVLDHGGQTFNACLPNPLGEEQAYRGRLFLGARHYRSPGAEEDLKYPDTRWELIKILSEHGDNTWVSDTAIAMLSGRWKDWLRIGWKMHVVKVKGYTDGT